MQVPASMASMAVIFCSIQPCSRQAEGDLELERNGEVERVAVCQRHAEYFMKYFNSDEIEDNRLVDQETVFVDDVGEDEMIDQIVEQGDYHAIIYGE